MLVLPTKKYFLSLITSSVLYTLHSHACSAAEVMDLGGGASVQLYGAVSPVYLQFDDGFDSNDTLADNNHLNTRIGFYLSQDLDVSKLTFHFESAIGIRQSNLITQELVPDYLHWDRRDIRFVDFIYDTPDVGKFSLGQGELAIFGVATLQDLSGTILANYASISDTAGSFRFRDENGELTPVSMFAAFQTYDGGRFGRLRYDSPSFDGLTISASVGTDVLTPATDDRYYDIAARYTGKFDAFQVVGAVGALRVEPDMGVSSTNVIGGIGVLHHSGLNFAVSGGNNSAGGTFGYAKLGYIANWFSVGSTAMAIDYYKGSDTVYNGSRTDTWGAGIVQTFEDINMFGYFEYRSYGLADDTPLNYRRASSIMTGITWTF